MDMLGIVALGFALWFFYEALKALLAGLQTQAPQSQFVLFIYCLIAGLVLLYEGGFFERLHR